MIIVNSKTGTYHDKEHLDERCNTDDILAGDRLEYAKEQLDLDGNLQLTTEKKCGALALKPCQWCIGRQGEKKEGDK
ncbi:MAG TPA: hypothetical protein VMW79_06060 [Anaerolineae bacterium]|nr:hypothetical protein [Anaerolineae bacterium]HUW96002.1 hypothetical protein [Anaerolineae bacterium]